MARPAIRDYLRAAAGTDPAGAADADLVARFARSRDETAFELLVWRHAGLVQRVCRSVLHDHHAAEDAAQATFLALARKAGTFAGRGPVVGWLYRVARRVSVRLARQRARLPTASEHLDRLPAADRPAGPDADELAALWAEIDRLPERYRVPVLLCFFEGLTHAEAARRTGWPVGTVAGRLARAKDRLARRLSGRGVGVAVGLPVVGGGFVGPTAAAAVPFAARAAVVPLVKPSVLTLAEGAVRTMSATILKLSAASVVLAAAVTAGVWAAAPAAAPQGAAAPPAAGAPPAQPPAAPGERLADAKQRYRGTMNLRQILLAFHNFHDVYNHFPADITDKDGKPLLSWRVAILPFMEQQALYQQFKLDEPWDGPNNKKLIEKMPDLYRTGIEPKGETKTYYQGFAGPGSIFEPGKKLTFINVTDGTSNTIAVVEAGPPVEWTRPADLPFDPKKPLPKRVGPFKNVMLVGMADGSVTALRPDLDDDVMKILVGRDDGIPTPNLDTLRPKLMSVGEEDAKVARDALAENAKLLKAIVEQFAEQQKLLEAAAKAGKLGDVPDIDRLLERQKLLERVLEEIRKETDELREHLKAKPGK
jgi:RNA polymerase sigma factor (sigma-70 family)